MHSKSKACPQKQSIIPQKLLSALYEWASSELFTDVCKQTFAFLLSLQKFLLKNNPFIASPAFNQMFERNQLCFHEEFTKQILSFSNSFKLCSVHVENSAVFDVLEKPFKIHFNTCTCLNITLERDQTPALLIRYSQIATLCIVFALYQSFASSLIG